MSHLLLCLKSFAIKIKNIEPIFSKVNFSFKNKLPINMAKIIPVSLKAPTSGIGA